MAIWILWHIDIQRRFNSRDSFPRRKLANWAPTSCRPGPILSLPSMNFELQAKTAEKIDIDKCNFRNFGRSVTLTWTWDWVEVTLVRISGQGLPTHQIRSKSEKIFCGHMDGRTHLSSNLLGDDLKIKNHARVIFHPCAGTPPLGWLLWNLAWWGDIVDVITQAKFYVNWFRGFKVLTPLILRFSIGLASFPYKSVSITLWFSSLALLLVLHRLLKTDARAAR